MGEGHLPTPVVQGKQPWLVLTLSLLQVYTKAEASMVLEGAASQHSEAGRDFN